MNLKNLFFFYKMLWYNIYNLFILKCLQLCLIIKQDNPLSIPIALM